MIMAGLEERASILMTAALELLQDPRSQGDEEDPSNSSSSMEEEDQKPSCP
jgi:hypothetical protein